MKISKREGISLLLPAGSTGDKFLFCCQTLDALLNIVQAPFFIFFSCEDRFFFGTDHVYAYDRRPAAQKLLYFFSGNTEAHADNPLRLFYSFGSDDVFF